MTRNRKMNLKLFLRLFSGNTVAIISVIKFNYPYIYINTQIQIWVQILTAVPDRL